MKKETEEQVDASARLLLNSTEADVWAAEFVRLHGGDEGLMLGWFANAIEVGRTAGELAQCEPPPAEVFDLSVDKAKLVAYILDDAIRNTPPLKLSDKKRNIDMLQLADDLRGWLIANGPCES